MSDKVRGLADRIAKTLHIPAGLALFLAIILVPKIVAVGMLIWSMVVWVNLKRRDGNDGISDK